MDPRIVNNNNRNANGFFLTHKRSDDPTAHKGEHAVYSAAVKFVSEQLKDSKIRSGNVLDSLELLEGIADKTLSLVAAECAKQRVENTGSRAYVWLIVVACLSTYHERIRRIREHDAE